MRKEKNIVELYQKNSKSKLKIAGLWCSKFGEDAELLVKYSNINFNKCKKNEIICEKYSKNYLTFFKNQMNKYHNLNWNKTHYEILLGIFVRFSINIFYDKWEMINYLLLKKNLDLKTVKSKDIYFKSDQDLMDNFDKKDFNNFLIDHIVNFLIKKKIIEKKKIIYSKKKSSSSNKVLLDKKLYLKTLISDIISKVYIKFANIALFHTYLPRFEEFKLNLKLGNFPYFFFNFHLNNNKIQNLNYSYKKRSVFLNYKSKDLFEECYSELLIKIFPTCYLENFQACFDEVNKIKNFPKVIGQTAPFYLNVFFKIFLILSKIKNNCKIITWQHGGHEFYRKIPGPFVTNQKIISSKLFNWSKNTKQNKSGLFYISKFIKERKMSFRSKEKITIFFGNHNYYYFPTGYDEFFHMNYSNYKNLKFITDTVFTKLNINNIIPSVRPFVRSKSNDDYYEYIKKNYKIDKTLRQKFNSVLNRTDLCIYFCDTTAFYNTLFMNIPSILIISENFLKKGFKNKKVYLEMFQKNFIFTCPIKASNFIVKINNSGIEKWWSRKDNKNLITKIKSNYMYKPKNRVSELKKILDKALID